MVERPVRSKTFININHAATISLLIPLLCSAFTHLWNPIGFLWPEHDESIYMQRALHVIKEFNVQSHSFGYDHPFFGQLFLGGALGILGYPDSVSPAVGDLHSIEVLWIIPRLLMGLLAVIDTFIVYKIAEFRYNRTVALIASVIFAIMPLTWYLRMMWLDTIQLPFILGSILLALYSEKIDKNRENKKILLILLSGVLLGLAIFTKIPAFTMIPLIGFLIFTIGSNKGRQKAFGLWIIPIITIPLIWPAYAIYIDEFNPWLTGIYQQTHRTGSFIDSIKMNLTTDPLLLLLGTVGILYGIIKKDMFIILWVIPYAFFSYLIGWTQPFHFILIFPAFCIAPAIFISDISKKVRNTDVQKILPFIVISAIGFIALSSTVIMITQYETSAFFEAEAFLTKYLHDNKNMKITVISNPFYLWIPQSVFHLDGDYHDFLSIRPINTEKVLFIVDDGFNDVFSFNTQASDRLNKIYKSYDTTELATFKDIKVLLSDVLHPSSQTQQISLLDKNHTWKPVNQIVLSQENGTLTIKVDTNKTKKISNRAFLSIHLNNTSSKSLLLTLDYFSRSIKGKAQLLAEISDNMTRKTLWSRLLNNTNGQSTVGTFFLPSNLPDRPLELRLSIRTQGPGEHYLTVKNMLIY